MDFIIDNYLWFGIFGVILLMALIGFLAEKTNFIKADSTPKSEKKKKEKKKTEKEDQVVNASEQTANATIETPTPEKTLKDVVAPAAPTVEPKKMQPEVTAAPTKSETEILQVDPIVTETGEDLTQPFGDTPVKSTTVKEAPTTTVNEQEDEDIWRF